MIALNFLEVNKFISKKFRASSVLMEQFFCKGVRQMKLSQTAKRSLRILEHKLKKRRRYMRTIFTGNGLLVQAIVNKAKKDSDEWVILLSYERLLDHEDGSICKEGETTCGPYQRMIERYRRRLDKLISQGKDLARYGMDSLTTLAQNFPNDASWDPINECWTSPILPEQVASDIYGECKFFSGRPILLALDTDGKIIVANFSTQGITDSNIRKNIVIARLEGTAACPLLEKIIGLNPPSHSAGCGGSWVHAIPEPLRVAEAA
jgi:hypothetical protein